MPSRYIEKNYLEGGFYHVFNRGVEKRDIFLDEQDYSFFLELLRQYLGHSIARDNKNRDKPNYYNDVELMAFCLMPNHFHMFIYQNKEDAMEKLMRSLCTSYSMYFNKKYKRVGSLFQDRYKAVSVVRDGQFTHISRYIHLNPLDIGVDYMEYPYSSLKFWLGSPKDKPDWLKPKRAMVEFKSKQEYVAFMVDYKNVKEELNLIKRSFKE